ncbi:MAG: hypothetical protein CSA54_03540 [Gammaproteobacteria bacterium]|nr:MAG: hypothetical protein CSA54_03540 [Gammaproteobacteria bacterium]
MSRRWYRAANERPLRAVPAGVWWVLVLGLLCQLGLRQVLPAAKAEATELPALPANAVVQSLFLGDGVLASRVLLLWLQARDTQSGALVRNVQRDYARLAHWLSQLQQLDPRSHYPLLLAVRVYSQASDKARVRQLLSTVNELFQRDPARYWRWQAEAAVLAKHRLQDLDLALNMAQALAAQTPPQLLPGWARDMRFILLEALGRDEEMRLLIGGLVASGAVTERKELQWLEQKLSETSASD